MFGPLDASTHILNVLGGEEFESRVHPFNFSTRGEDLAFEFPYSRRNRSNMVKIVYNDDCGMDVYFYRKDARKRIFEKREEFLGIHKDKLAELFKERTGL